MALASSEKGIIDPKTTKVPNLARIVEPASAPAATQPIPSAPQLATEITDEEFPEDYPDFYSSDFMSYLANQSATGILSKREDTRGRLALIYTLATFTMFVLGFIVAVLDAAWRGSSIIDNLSQILPLISGIFLGTLGFVLGYYFRKAEGEQNDSTDVIGTE